MSEWVCAWCDVYNRVPSRRFDIMRSPGAFALAVSAHPAGIRAILLVGTASARLKREPFAALYACTQIQIPINRPDELSPKRFLKGDWTNAKLWRGAQPVYFQKQSDWRATRLHVYSKGSSHFAN